MTPEEKKEKAKAYQKVWYKKNREKVLLLKRKQYLENKEEILEKFRERWKSNPLSEEQKEQRALYKKEWSQRNKDHIRKRNRIYAQNNQEKIKLSSRRGTLKTFGLSLEEYDQMLADQNYCCLICSTHADELTVSLNVDHCHTTNKVRGLLCGNCNRMLGMAKDDPEILRKAIEYLCQPT